MPQLSATAFFCFGLAILCVGYIIVEIFWGNKYPKKFQNILNKYNNNLFDRVIHYVIRGGLIDIAVILFLRSIGAIKGLVNIFNGLNGVVKNSDGSSSIEFQLITFSIIFFAIVMIIFIIFFASGRFGRYMGSKRNKSK